jgi:hypothetical protein
LKIKLTCVLLVAVIAVFVVLPSCTVSAQTGASSAISSAQNTFNTCYEAAKEAEAAGANITVLQDTLNTAGAQLSLAETSNAQGDYGSANNYAQQAQNTLSNFVSQANSLKTTASQQQQTSFLLNVVGSIAGTFAVIVGSMVVWRNLKKKNPPQVEASANES